jgi:dolichol kinase
MIFDTTQVDWVFVVVSVLLSFIILNLIFLFKALKMPKWQVRKLGHIILHIFLGFFPYFFENIFDVIVTVVIIAGILIVVSLIPKLSFLQRIVEECTREGEKKYPLVLNGFSTAFALLVIFFVFAYRDMVYIYTIAVLAVALGDGLGEMIGRPYGRLKYKIFAERSVEGSFFVFFGSFMGIIITFGFNNMLPLSGFWWKAVVIAAVAMLVEAFNYKFIDNTTLLISVAFVTFLLFEL